MAEIIEGKPQNKTRIVDHAKGDSDHAKDLADLRAKLEKIATENVELRGRVTAHDNAIHKLASAEDPDRAKKIEDILGRHGLHQWARGRVEAQHVRAVLLALAEVL